MALNRKITIPMVLLVAIALSGLASLVYLFFSLQQEIADQQMEFREDIVWWASQVEREARVFRHDLMLYSLKDSTVAYEDVRRWFDVLWSRIETMDKGELGATYIQLQGGSLALERGREMLHDVDPILTHLQAGDGIGRNEILKHLDPLIIEFSKVAKRASEFSLLHQESKRQSFERTGKISLFLVVVVFLSGATLFFILINNQYHLDEITHNLEGKVQERTSELKESNQSLKMMSQAIEQSPVSVIICNIKGEIEYVNPKFVEVTGYAAEEALGKNPRFLQSGKTSQKTYKEMWQAVHADRTWKGEICNRRKNGKLFWEHVSLSPIRDTNDQLVGYIAVKEDISQRKSYEEQLVKQANFDSLTGLPNRLLAMDRLKQAILQSQRRGDIVALLFIDLDNFKTVNDTLGHDLGDLLLKDASQRFLGCLRHCDTAARFGGDEFLIILSELQGRNDVKPILDRILKAFSQPFDLGGQKIVSTTSIGVSMCPEDSTLTAELLKKSDRAMYIAKRKGKNSYRFYEENMGC